jgi:hypothetical protein
MVEPLLLRTYFEPYFEPNFEPYSESYFELFLSAVQAGQGQRARRSRKL